MATWKKVIVSGSSISQLSNDLGYIASVGGGILSGSSAGTAQGQFKLNGVDVSAKDLSTTSNVTFAQVTGSLKGNVVGNVTGNLTGAVTGNADTATTAAALTTARNIGGVSFNGSADINLPGVNATGNQNTSGTAATASYVAFDDVVGLTTTSASIAADIAALEVGAFDLQFTGDSGTGVITNAETLTIAGGTNIGTVGDGDGVTVNLDANISLTSVTASLQGNVVGAVTGNASTATALQTARDFSVTGGGITATAVSFNGTGAVALNASIDANAVTTVKILDANVTNAKLANSGSVIGSTPVVLGATVTTLAGLTSVTSTGFTGALTGNADSATTTTGTSTGQGLVTVGTNNNIDLGLQTSASPTFANLVLTGNLTVQGTTTELNTANLNVEDQFILINSGGAAADGGLVVNGAGAAIGWDEDEKRFALDFEGATFDQATIGTDAFVAAVVTTNDPNYQKNGNIWIDGSGNINIYVE
jgi:hypothetical protein